MKIIPEFNTKDDQLSCFMGHPAVCTFKTVEFVKLFNKYFYGLCNMRATELNLKIFEYF